MPYSGKIRNLSAQKNTEVQLACAIYWYQESTPPLSFEKDVINAINNLGASLDLDLYMLGAVKNS
jgi:hypothetical protein